MTFAWFGGLYSAQANDTGAGVTKSNELNIGPTVPGGTAAAPGVAKTCKPVSIERAGLVLVGDAIHLRVSGEQPHEGMTLEVRPVVYLMQPDYWQMALVACVPEGTPLSGPATQFVSEINVSGWVGRKGIDLSGGAKFKPLRIERPA